MGTRKTRIPGLTLSEIMISISLLALMLVTTITLFAQLLASTTKNGYLDAASVYADRLLEQAVSAPSSSSPAFLSSTTGEDLILVEGDTQPTKFVYRIEATEIGDGSDGGERWLLDVEVRWWTDDIDSTNTSRPGYGELKTSQSRLVYIKW
jgi:hypothetical protein